MPTMTRKKYTQLHCITYPLGFVDLARSSPFFQMSILEFPFLEDWSVKHAPGVFLARGGLANNDLSFVSLARSETIVFALWMSAKRRARICRMRDILVALIGFIG
jgi:hypothetical protein